MVRNTCVGCVVIINVILGGPTILYNLKKIDIGLLCRETYGITDENIRKKNTQCTTI